MRTVWKRLLEIIPALCAFAALLAVFGALSLIALPIIASGFAAFYICKKKAELSAGAKKDIEQAAASLLEIRSSLVSGRTLPDSLSSSAARARNSGHIKEALTRISKRTAFGQDLGKAISAELWRFSKSGKLLASFSALREEYNDTSSIGRAARGAAIALKGHLDEVRENDSGRLQRYIIAAMVASTIIPSIITFAFVGYSILYYSGLLLLVYSSIMLGILPFAYGIARIKLVSVYDA